jgi:hypothetical protein
MPGAAFSEIVEAAYMERVDLSAHGFYATPGVTGFGGEAPFNYFCYGAAVSEVDLDALSGDFHLLRTDLCMDVGRSLNPAIDIGQVRGLRMRRLPSSPLAGSMSANPYVPSQQCDPHCHSTVGGCTGREGSQPQEEGLARTCRWRAASCRAWAGPAWRSWSGATRSTSGCRPACCTRAAQVRPLAHARLAGMPDAGAA